jgi:hypothetical protein
MPRRIDLIVYTNPKLSHWALFIPAVGTPDVGKIIHVVGTPFSGFGLEFKRNYKLDKTKRKFRRISLGEVDDKYVKDVEGDGNVSQDVESHDILEQKAKQIPPPGISPAPLDPTVVWRAFCGRLLYTNLFLLV